MCCLCRLCELCSILEFYIAHVTIINLKILYKFLIYNLNASLGKKVSLERGCEFGNDGQL